MNGVITTQIEADLGQTGARDWVKAFHNLHNQSHGFKNEQSHEFPRSETIHDDSQVGVREVSN